MANDFLKELPCFNKDNFSRFNSDDIGKTVTKKPALYIQTSDNTSLLDESQVIVTDKTNILLRYLRQQVDAKNTQSKRSMSMSDTNTPSRKVARMESSEQTMND